MQRAIPGRRARGGAATRGHVCIERSPGSSPVLVPSAAHRVASLALRAADMIPPLDRPVLSNDPRSRRAWEAVVLAAAEGLQLSAGSDGRIIDAAREILGTGQPPLVYELLGLAAGMCG